MTNYIKSILLLFLLLSRLVQTVEACDACGCALGGFNFGIIPQNEAHFIGMKYSTAHFYADMMHGGNLEYSHDLYQRIDVMGRIALKDRLQLNVVLPYMYNTMNGSHEKEQLKGLGDPMLMLNLKVIDQSGNPMEKWLHNLWLGGGIKAPLAPFEYSKAGDLINPNFQLGSGSFDYLAMVNYTSMRNRFGLNVEAVYKINTLNSQQYRFGNQYNAQANGFYTTKLGNLRVLPLVGVYHEYGGQHTHEGFFQANSGGQSTMAQVGIQGQFGSWMVHSNFQKPIQQAFNSDSHVTIEARNRFSVTFIRFIGTRSEKSVFSFQ
jgi:hypothetical protein